MWATALLLLATAQSQDFCPFKDEGTLRPTHSGSESKFLIVGSTNDQPVLSEDCEEHDPPDKCMWRFVDDNNGIVAIMSESRSLFLKYMHQQLDRRNRQLTHTDVIANVTTATREECHFEGDWAPECLWEPMQATAPISTDTTAPVRCGSPAWIP